MLRIDIHTHILPPEIPKYRKRFGYGGFIHWDDSCQGRLVHDDGSLFRECTQNCWSPKTRIGDCDNAAISVQVLSTVPVMFSYWARPKDALEVSKYLNDHIAETVQTYPNRFVGLATVPLQDPQLAARELERAVLELGLVGAEIGSHVNQWNLSEPVLYPFFETAQRLGACLFVHPWDMMGKERMPKYWLPWLVGMPAEVSLSICSMIFGGIFERFPNLRVAFAHGGGAFAGTLGRIDHGFRVRPDLCAVDNAVVPSQYIGRFYVDSLVHDKAMLSFLMERFGPRCIALGSDYPFPLGETKPGALIDSMPISENDKARMFSGTALEWLNLTQESFSL